MTLSPGSELVHYHLVEQIGGGGMGVVWRALDTSLDREAKRPASLSHPNSEAVYGLHKSAPPTGSVYFLAMELVSGNDPATGLGGG